ncbi:MAG: acyl-CoA dehydrogenase family protein, partial [Lautropia sp.]
MAVASFEWSDPFGIHDQLTEEERAVEAAANEFARTRLQGRVAGDFRHERFDRALIREMGERGFLGPTLAGYGCAGVSATSYGLIARALESVDSGYRSAMSVQSSLVMLPIHDFGSEAQRERYLPRLATGELIGCFGLTEPDHGSDPGRMGCRAVEARGGYVLRGTKTWISNAPVADIFVVWAKDESGAIRGFVLERGMEGLSSPRLEGKFSMRASETGMIVMDDVHVPAENLLAGSRGLKSPFHCLYSARLGSAWGARGAAQACWETARQFVL